MHLYSKNIEEATFTVYLLYPKNLILFAATALTSVVWIAMVLLFHIYRKSETELVCEFVKIWFYNQKTKRFWKQMYTDYWINKSGVQSSLSRLDLWRTCPPLCKPLKITAAFTLSMSTQWSILMTVLIISLTNRSDFLLSSVSSRCCHHYHMVIG